MAEVIAVVLEVEGDVWARDADGEMRLLRAGDSVYAGETVVTAQDARVNLDLDNGETVQLAGGQSMFMSTEMLADAEPSSDEQAVTDPGAEEVLALLEGDGDILEELEDPAAGTTGGGEGGGRTIVEVTRIVEQIDPLAFNFADPAREPNEPIPGVTGVDETEATDEPATPIIPEDPDAPDETTPAITVNLDDQNSQTVTESLISGTTTNVEAGQTVTIEVTDGENTVNTSAIVQSDGSYQLVEDLSSLSDGELTATATVSDQAGNQATNTDTAILDTEASATITIYTIAGDDVINEAEAEGDEDGNITISGRVGVDAGEGDTVTLTIWGKTFTGTVDGDNTYAIDVPVILLVNGGLIDIPPDSRNPDFGEGQNPDFGNGDFPIPVPEGGLVQASVSGSDDAGNPYYADTTRPYTVDTWAWAEISIDTIAGDDVINGDEAQGDITIIGSVTGDATEGDTVTLTVGDETYTGEVDDQNGYAIDVPGSVLLENDQVGASVTGSDEAGNDFSASASREYALNTPPVAYPVSTTAEVFNAEAVLPGGVSESPLLFKQFSVDGTVDGDNAEPSPTLGGDDAETPLDELKFTLESIPTSGTLFIDIEGDGTYASAQQGDEFSNDSTFYWLDDGAGSNTINVDFSQAPAADSGITLYAYGYDGAQDNRLLNFQGDGVGVSDDPDNNLQQQVPNQLGYRDGNSQTLVMDFDDPAHDAEISISRLIKNEGEVGKVEAYLDGEQIGAWTFSGVDGATLDSVPVDFNIGGSNGSFSLPDGIVFDQLRFTATEYADGTNSGGSGNDSSDYFVDSIDFKTFNPAEFTYSVKDGHGDESDPVKVEISTPDTYTAVHTSFETDEPPTIALSSEEIEVDEAFLEGGTRDGENPAGDDPGSTANGQITLSAPAGLGVLSIAAAGLASENADFNADAGLVTLNADQLAALNNEPVEIETPEGNILSLTGFDSASGTVDYTFELTGPVTNDKGTPLDKAPIGLYLTDANGTTAQATLNVAILDDGVDTADDPLAIIAGDTSSGNVLDNDSGADVDLQVTSIRFGEQDYAVPEGGDLIIEGDHGTLTIERDGSYSYEANDVESVNISGDEANWLALTGGLWGFGGDTPIPTTDGKLDFPALGIGNDNVGFSDNAKKSGVGVSINQSAKIDSDDSLLIGLDDSTSSATVSIAQFNANQAEVGRWTAYDDGGQEVGSSSFNPVNNNGFPFDLVISTPEPFSYLQFDLDTASKNKNAGYVVEELTYSPAPEFGTDAFIYSVEDQDGSTADATLSFATYDVPSDDVLIGGESDDVLIGGEGDDVLIGGAGNDELTGGQGDDVFKWELADRGDVESPAEDVITDFGEGQNVLDLRDLLVDEETEDKSIIDFLSVTEDGDDLVFQVTHDGESGGPTQTIRLEGMQFNDFGEGINSSQELIDHMMENGQLDIDT